MFLLELKGDFFMKRNKLAILVYVVIGLAVVGLFSQLFGNTKNFFINIFIMLGVTAAIFALFYFVLQRRRGSSDDMKKYKQAVKQSKHKYQQKPAPKNTPQPKVKRNTGTVRKGKKRATHLTVIEGNKSKEKDRASN